MTGPEHYRAAERMLARVNKDEDGRTEDVRRDIIQAAQVHATLALAAATALAGVGQEMHADVARACVGEWEQVLS